MNSKEQTHNHQGCRGRLGRLGAGTLGVVLLLTLTGALYQQIASHIDRLAHPHPGRLIDVGGYRLHLFCLGDGEPTVILEAGLPENSLHWRPIHAQLAAMTTVCAYDRAGLGWSEPSPWPLTSNEVARTLHRLLEEADIPGPFILVGHSMGGLHVRSFARLYPAEVKGIVLVDSSHENQNLRLPQEFALRNSPLTDFVCRYLAPLGLLRLLNIYGRQIENAPYSSEERLNLIALRNQTHFCRAQINEQTAGEIDLSQPNPPAGLGDLPLVVLSAGVGLSATDPASFPFPITSDDLRNADQVHRKLQLELVELSSNSTRIVARHSGHNIHHDQPELVIAAVRNMMETITQGVRSDPVARPSGGQS